MRDSSKNNNPYNEERTKWAKEQTESFLAILAEAMKIFRQAFQKKYKNQIEHKKKRQAEVRRPELRVQ